MRYPFPSTPHEITPEWLTDQLAAFGFARSEIVGLRTELLGAGVGLAGVVVRITLDYSDSEPAGPRTLIGKFATANAANLDMMTSYDLYRREVAFYNTVAKHITARIPTCYRAEVSDDGRACVVLLEDFPDHAPGDQVVGCSVEDAHLVMVESAKLHAAFWSGQRPEGVRTYDNHGKQLEIITDSVWPSMVAALPDLIPDWIVALREKYCAAMPSTRDWITRAANTVAHGDLRVDNVLFGPSSDPKPVLIDWQLPTWAPGVLDLAYLLTQSISPEDRRQNEQALLGAYRAQLAQLGVFYDADRCWEDYRRSSLATFGAAVIIAGGLDATSDRAKHLMRAVITRAISAFEDLDLMSVMLKGL